MYIEVMGRIPPIMTSVADLHRFASLSYPAAIIQPKVEINLFFGECIDTDLEIPCIDAAEAT